MKYFVIVGTRPEALKMASVVQAFQKDKNTEIKLIATSQHLAMLQQVLSLFNLKPDYDLQLMKHNQNLCELSQGVLKGLNELFLLEKPDRILVQGDTTSAFIASLAAFYHQIPVAHVEAGIRSYNNFAPFPEEMNRKLISVVADLHFAPTTLCQKNLINEDVNPKSIYVTGNTIIDVLLETTKNPLFIEQYKDKFPFLDASKKLILVTAHRRESFGKPFEEICKALLKIAKLPDVQIIYPVHPNPHVQGPVNKYLKNIENIILIEPQDYFSMIYLLSRCYLVLTDSGGIQEEAPTFHKPLLVMREVTERVEGVNSGVAKIVGTKTRPIFEAAEFLLGNDTAYAKMSNKPNPYGNGQAAQKIVSVLSRIHGNVSKFNRRFN